jgi:hypothetical protein
VLKFHCNHTVDTYITSLDSSCLLYQPMFTPGGTSVSFGGLGTGIKSTSDAHNSHKAGIPSNSDFDQKGRPGTSSDLDDDVFAEKLSFPHAYKKVRALRIGSTKGAKLCGLRWNSSSFVGSLGSCKLLSEHSKLSKRNTSDICCQMVKKHCCHNRDHRVHRLLIY